MSKPVTKSVVGKNFLKSSVSFGQPREPNGHNEAENQVSSTSSSCVSSRHQVDKIHVLRLRRIQHKYYLRIMPGRNAVSPPNLSTDTPILDIIHPIKVGLSQLPGWKTTSPLFTASLAFWPFLLFLRTTDN